MTLLHIGIIRNDLNVHCSTNSTAMLYFSWFLWQLYWNMYGMQIYQTLSTLAHIGADNGLVYAAQKVMLLCSFIHVFHNSYILASMGWNFQFSKFLIKLVSIKICAYLAQQRVLCMIFVTAKHQHIYRTGFHYF